jgi:hypothetical protein
MAILRMENVYRDFTWTQPASRVTYARWDFGVKMKQKQNV